MRTRVLYCAIGVVLAFHLPRIGQLVPDRWWYDMRDVRVSSGGLGVTIDRDIWALWGDGEKLVDSSGLPCAEGAAQSDCHLARFWVGDFDVNIRRITGVSDAPSNCSGSRHGLTFVEGAPYPAEGRNLNWFTDSPPNPDCELPDGAYVTEFTVSRTWFGIRLETTRSSNTFFVGPIPTGTGSGS